MTDTNQTVALVGAVGGAGVTRTTLELAGALSVAGRSVAVLDAAYATQGLTERVSGRIDPDLTALCLDPERPLAAGLYDPGIEVDLDVVVEGESREENSESRDHPQTDATDAATAVESSRPEPGRVALAPVRAPFERVARAKAPAAAQTLGERIEAAAEAFEVVLVDVPPVAANQSIAAVHAADRLAVVAPADAHGADGRRRTTDTLRDVGVAPDASVAVEATARDADDRDAASDADAVIPPTPGPLHRAPAWTAGDRAGVAPALVTAAETVVGTDLGVEFPDDGLAGRVRAGVDRVRERAQSDD